MIQFVVCRNARSIEFNIVHEDALTFCIDEIRKLKFEINKQIVTKEIDIVENGVYLPPSGTAYSKVTVDVPVPSDYGLIRYNGYEINIS